MLILLKLFHKRLFDNFSKYVFENPILILSCTEIFAILFNINLDMGFNTMTALSIHLSDKLAKDSQKAAQHLGISRAEFIRQAVAHELENMRARLELEAMVNSFVAMKKHPDYLEQLDEIDNDASDNLPNDEDEWWKKK